LLHEKGGGKAGRPARHFSNLVVPTGMALALAPRVLGGARMNLALWLPLMFVFGLLLIAFCYWLSNHIMAF
jgi:hypothetical protein